MLSRSKLAIGGSYNESVTLSLSQNSLNDGTICLLDKRQKRGEAKLQIQSLPTKLLSSFILNLSYMGSFMVVIIFLHEHGLSVP